MPSASAKQARTMRAAAHDPEFARKMHILQKVAKEFMKEDMAEDRKEDRKKKGNRKGHY